MLIPLTMLLLAAPMQPTRYDMAIRLKQLDKAWVSESRPVRREAAVTLISGAVTGFFSGQTGAVCRSLDESVAALRGSKPTPEDALIARTDPAVVEPGGSYTLRVGWAYPFGTLATLSDKGATLTIRGAEVAAVSLRAPAKEGSYLLFRRFPLQVVRNFDQRVTQLAKDARTSPIATALAEAAAGTYETPVPVAKWLAVGEQIRQKGVSSTEEVPVAEQDGVRFRALMPKRAAADAPVVIALHGAGGSENMFFESYGAGMAVEEARRRGWIFMSPRSNPRAVAACLAWLKGQRQVSPRAVFVMGHSMGGGVALAKATLDTAPTAIAAFAPAVMGSLPDSAGRIPIFVAVGKQEMMMLKSAAGALAGKAAIYREYDRCEHLMIVADACADAYRFFDSKLPR